MYVSLSTQVAEAHRKELLAEAERLSLVAQALRERKARRQHRAANAVTRPLRRGLAVAASLIHGLLS